MNSKLSYSGISAKIHGMRRHLLTDEDFVNIVNLDSVTDVLEYIKKVPSYAKTFDSFEGGDLTHRDAIEKVLLLCRFDDYEKLFKFSSMEQRNFLKLYFMRYEISFLKVCFNNLIDGKSIQENVKFVKEFFEKHSKLNMDALMEVDDINKLIDFLMHTDYSKALAYTKSIDNPTFFDYEVALDLYYFQRMWKRKEETMTGIDCKELDRILGTKYDLQNLMWLYRFKSYYNMPDASIYSFLIPIYHKLSSDEIHALVDCEDLKAFDDVISKTYYFKKYGIEKAADIEANYSRIMTSLFAHEARTNPASIAVIYSYLYHKDHEVAKIIVALECVRYKQPQDVALKHIERA